MKHRAFLSLVVSFALPLAIVGCANSADDSQHKPPAPLESSSAIQPLSDNDPLHAYVDELRADLSDGKVHIINNVMELTTAEAKIFWPIYSDYETELFALGDQRVALMREFLHAEDTHTLDDKEAAKLADGYFQYETARLELLKKYYDIYAKALSPIRAAQFTQIENCVGNLVDVMLASGIPLIRHYPARATQPESAEQAAP